MEKAEKQNSARLLREAAALPGTAQLPALEPPRDSASVSDT